MKRGKLIVIKILATLGSLWLVPSIGIILQSLTKIYLIKIIMAIIFLMILFGLLDLIWEWNIVFKKRKKPLKKFK